MIEGLQVSATVISALCSTPCSRSSPWFLNIHTTFRPSIGLVAVSMDIKGPVSQKEAQVQNVVTCERILLLFSFRTLLTALTFPSYPTPHQRCNFRPKPTLPIVSGHAYV